MKKHFIIFLLFLSSILKFLKFINDFSDRDSKYNLILLSNINNMKAIIFFKLHLFIKYLSPNENPKKSSGIVFGKCFFGERKCGAPMGNLTLNR